MTDNNHLQTQLDKISIAYQDALQIDRLKTGFLGRIAHEIRSPLGSMIGLHQLIINDLCDSPEEERESIKQAYESAKKLMAMIDQVIEVSKLQVGRIELEIQEFNLSELLEDIYNIISLEVANKNLKLQLENQTTNSIIKTDKVRLTNILLYLLEVAIDESEGRLIKLTLDEEKNKQQYLLSISFTSDSFSLEQPTQIQKSHISPEELKTLHSSPQFSNQMKTMLAETLLKIMGGYLRLQQPHNQENQLMELRLSLPVETLKPNY
jgi:signal transduction histidine kinase